MDDACSDVEQGYHLDTMSDVLIFDCGDCGHDEVQKRGWDGFCPECNGPMLIRDTHFFTVGCTDCGGHYVWTEAQLLNEGTKPAVGGWVNFCDNGVCNGAIHVNGDLAGTLVVADEKQL